MCKFRFISRLRVITLSLLFLLAPQSYAAPSPCFNQTIVTDSSCSSLSIGLGGSYVLTSGASISLSSIGIHVYTNPVTSLINSGDVSGSRGLEIGSSISEVVNNGSLTGTGGAGEFGMMYSGPANLTNTSMVNTGDITGYWGLLVQSSAPLMTLTNIGNINSNANQDAININSNGGAYLNTLNNLQGASNSSPLTYGGNLPAYYNVIINSVNNYGQLLVGNYFTGSTTFGIYGSAVGFSPVTYTNASGGTSIIAASTLSAGTYAGVLQGISASSLAGLSANNTLSGSYSGFNWLLALQTGSTSVWDLLVSLAGPSTADTQSSLHSLASKLRGAFSGQAMVTNFANMNTYDCNLFDAKGLCVSVGGQQTYVDSPSANMTSVVVVAGYKVSPTLRIGGFLNQNVNSNTGSNVDISNNSPLMGLFAVWNQNENHLGYQVKIANAYQDMDVTTTRDVIGTSEAGKGKTDLNTQSYVGELSYAFLTNEDKTLVRPYAALRYTRIKQDSYTERTTTAVTAPLTYAALSDRSTAALVGVKLNHKLTDKVNLTGSLGVEQDLNHDVDNLTASGVSGLTSEAFNNNINHTRPVASVGAYYMPVKNQRIAADIYYQELPFQSTASTTAYVNYMIGF